MAESKVKFHGKPGILPQALCRSRDLSPFAKTVFGLLTTYKEAFPGQPWLADHVPCSEPTVRKAIKELELHGWIKRERRNRRKNETDLYHVYLEAPLEIEDRPQWAQRQLGLPKANYGNEITVKRLPKLGFGEKLEPSVQVKVSDKTPCAPDPLAEHLCNGSYSPSFEQVWANFRALKRAVNKRGAAREWNTTLKTRMNGDPPAAKIRRLILAAENFRRAMELEQRTPDKILHPSTFFGRDMRWEDYEKWTPPQRGTQQARGRSADEYAGLMKGAE